MPGTTAFPTALDTSTFPDIDGAVDDMDAPPHDEQHNNAAAAILAVETKLGIDGSADTASIDYRVAMLERFKYCRDDLLATGGETSITLGAAIYSNSLEVFVDGSLLPSAAYSVSEPTVTLSTPATAAELYAVRFMTLDASPAAAILGIVYDSDAMTFFTAASITDAGQKGAVSALVVDLKAAGVWAKCLAIYPLVGGIASSHAVNLKSPGTYDITWSGTITHSATGVQGDGSTGYGLTGLTPLSAMAADSAHISAYSRTNSAGTYMEVGAYDGTHMLGQYIKHGSGICYSYVNSPNGSDAAQIASGSNGSSDAFYVSSRTGSAAVDHSVYRNGSAGATTGILNLNQRPNVQVGILARNDSASQTAFSAREVAFISIGGGLSPTECGDLYTAVQAYQTTLGRQV